MNKEERKMLTHVGTHLAVIFVIWLLWWMVGSDSFEGLFFAAILSLVLFSFILGEISDWLKKLINARNQWQTIVDEAKAVRKFKALQTRFDDLMEEADEEFVGRKRLKDRYRASQRPDKD